MLRALRILSLIALLPASGCVVAPHHHGGASRHFLSSGKSKSCPPGHVWDDGRCHSKGRGHGKDKHGKH